MSCRIWAKQKNLSLIHFPQRFFYICGVFFLVTLILCFHFWLLRFQDRNSQKSCSLASVFSQTDHESSGSFTEQITRVIWITSTWGHRNCVRNECTPALTEAFEPKDLPWTQLRWKLWSSLAASLPRGNVSWWQLLCISIKGMRLYRSWWIVISIYTFTFGLM